MGRKLPYNVITWKINVPVSIAGRVELALSQENGMRVRYGTRSKLIEDLLRGWLEERTAAPSSDEEPELPLNALTQS